MSKETLEQPIQNNDRADAAFSRRGFIKIAAAGIGCGYAAAIGYPVYKYLNAPVAQAIADAAKNTLDLKDADKLPLGSTLMFSFNTVPSMLIHFADGTWVALSAVCTHLGCTLHYQPPEKTIYCACHGGEYDPRTGKNLSGPPPSPLTKYSVNILPGKASITRA